MGSAKDVRVLVSLIFGGEVSLGSLVGFVTVFGIILRNSIMLISHHENLDRERAAVHVHSALGKFVI